MSNNLSLPKLNVQQILIVEDDPINQQLFEMVFSKTSVAIYIVRNSQLALEYLKKNSPDFIILDIVLPDRNGRDLANIIRQIPGFATIPILAVSALATLENKELCLAAGMNGFMAKPFSIYELLNSINYLSEVDNRESAKAALKSMQNIPNWLKDDCLAKISTHRLLAELSMVH